MKRFGKIALWILMILLAAAILFAAVVAVKYYRVKHSGAKVELISGPAFEKAIDRELGGKSNALITVFRLPWGVRPLAMNVQPAPGSQLVEPPRFIRQKRGWGNDLWESRILLQCYREGDIKSAPAQAVFSNRQIIDLQLPSMRVSAPTGIRGDQLELAGEMEIVRKNTGKRVLIWIFAGLLILAAIILIVLHYRKRKQARIIPPWEKALSAIQSLLEQVRIGAAHPEKSIARLTDIVREYMEQRFQLRAERQTTAEFMADLERGSGNLSREHRDFLKNFLTAADMVKFARVSADRSLFEDAAGKAGELIRATTPHEDGKENKE
ncbi:MAG: hypothetical protein IKO93_13970 [Lentisphaeria bacterium]|nr:hypothetical protein [Lentisphaeria bacterium]